VRRGRPLAGMPRAHDGHASAEDWMASCRSVVQPAGKIGRAGKSTNRLWVGCWPFPMRSPSCLDRRCHANWMNRFSSDWTIWSRRTTFIAIWSTRSILPSSVIWSVTPMPMSDVPRSIRVSSRVQGGGRRSR